MKNLIAIAAVVLSLTACGTGASTETPTTDSTKVDSTKVVADTTKVVDTVKAAK